MHSQLSLQTIQVSRNSFTVSAHAWASLTLTCMYTLHVVCIAMIMHVCMHACQILYVCLYAFTICTVNQENVVVKKIHH